MLPSSDAQPHLKSHSPWKPPKLWKGVWNTKCFNCTGFKSKKTRLYHFILQRSHKSCKVELRVWFTDCTNPIWMTKFPCQNNLYCLSSPKFINYKFFLSDFKGKNPVMQKIPIIWLHITWDWIITVEGKTAQLCWRDFPRQDLLWGILPSTIQPLEEQDPSTLCMATVSFSPEI